MPRTLSGKSPPEVVFSSEEIKQTTSNMNQPLVTSVSTINTKIRRVFINQGSSADIMSRRCFDALGLTESDLEAHSDNLVGFSRERFVTDNGEVGVLKGDVSKAKRCHSATLHNSKEQLPRSANPDTVGKIHLVDLEPPGRKIPERPQPEGELDRV
ncbi:hypothetical protein PIB30_052304 [Stylosanthes scabra]|uniref:Uncharacterized protein n=1 Tax=Stylosanthes scabra TaxID=79078 RepID=A0ABU6SI06_9FABA|nr:hypothetical protein [Stylosanthes scabra]